MQHAMYDYAMQLVFHFNSELFCVFSNAVNTDVDVAVDLVWLSRNFLRKGDDVSKGIVIEVLHIDLVKVFIRAENEIKLSRF